MSLFPIPSSVAAWIKKLQKEFLWGIVSDEFKSHLVNWNQVCEPLQAGRRGVCHLHSFNQALLGKCFGILPRKKMPFREELLLPSMVLSGVAGPRGVFLWKNIRGRWIQFFGYICFLGWTRHKCSVLT